MRKFLILNLSTIALGFLLFLNIDRLLAYTWNWAPVFALLPVAAGALTVLLQDEDKSYKYLPKLIASSLIFSFATIFLLKLFVYFGDNVNASIFNYFNPFKDFDEMVGHFGLAGIYFLGGLIGLVVRGVNLVFFPERKFIINLEISFIKSFILGAVFLLAANFYYVFAIGFSHHGRWKLELPVTSLFLALYLVLFFSYAKRAIKDPKYNYIVWAYNLLLSLAFLSNAETVRVFFQDEMYLYYSYIAVAPYVVLLGFGLLGFIALSFMFKNVFRRPKTKTIFKVSLIVVLVAVISAFLIRDKIKAAYIVKEIRKANYCQIDSDCQDIFAGTGGQCPFGCHAIVNKNEAERIGNLVDSFDSTCVYSCMHCPTTRCDNGICTAVCDERRSRQGYFRDSISGLEISYPTTWANNVNIRHVEDEDKKSLQFDYINGNDTKFLFSLSFYPRSFGLDKIYSQDNQRPIYQTDDYIITVAEGEMPSKEDYGLIYYGIDEVLADLKMDDDSFRPIETEEDIYWQYKDDEYGFSIDYPSNLKVRIINDEIRKYPERMGGGEELIDKVITFVAPNGGPGMASINIFDNPGVSTLDEWLDKKNEKPTKMYEGRDGHYLRMVIDERINIDGNEAMVVYQESDMEAHEYEKTAAFFKDGKLFTIYGRCKDCTKWWEGFKFFEQENLETYVSNGIGLKFNYPDKLYITDWHSEPLEDTGSSITSRVFDGNDAIFTLSAYSPDYYPGVYEGTQTFYSAEPLDANLSKNEIAREFEYLQPFSIEYTDVGGRRAVSFYGITSYAWVAASKFVIIPNPGNEYTNIVIMGPFLAFKENMDGTIKENTEEIKRIVSSGEYLKDKKTENYDNMFNDILQSVVFIGQ